MNTCALHKASIYLLKQNNFYITSKCYIMLSQTSLLSGSSGSLTMFVSVLMLPVNGPEQQLWRQGAPIPFSLTIINIH